MTHHYTDEEIQAAINTACEETSTTYPEISELLTLRNYTGSDYAQEAPARLHLLKSALDKLQEPPPPTADGKTPGQVAFEAWGNQSDEWHKSLCSNWQAAASAVLAAFGGAELEAAIARMEAVPWFGRCNCFNAVRARLISAAKGEQP